MNNSIQSVSVVLPTYKERGNIAALIEAIQESLGPMNYPLEIVVVDDNSPDGTADVVRERFAGDSRVRLIVRENERGLATAILRGLRESHGDVVVVMDTDFNHDPGMLPQMVKFLEYYDIVIGSRYTMGGGMEDQLRYYASYLYNFFVRLVLRTQVQDNLSGFFAIMRHKLFQLDVDLIFQGYGEYFMRLLFLAWTKQLLMLEVPVFYNTRRHGQSKSNFRHMLWDYTLTALRIRHSGLGLPWTLQRRSFFFAHGQVHEFDENTPPPLQGGTPRQAGGVN